MIHNAQEFLEGYGWESETTAKLLGNVTNASMGLEKAPGHLNLGQLAWHIASAPAMMLRQTEFDLPDHGWAPPADLSAAKIQQTYASDTAAIKEQVAKKTPEDLARVFHVFGMMDWNVNQMLGALIVHEVHHRGQLSVLMRQAGLVVPSIYGPNAEETAEMMKNMQQG